MKHTILVCMMTAGLAWAQSPEIIQNTRSMMQAVQQKETRESNAALDGVPSANEATKKSPSVQAVPFRGGSPVAPAKTNVPAVKAAPAKASAPVVKAAPAKASAPVVKAAPAKASAPTVKAASIQSKPQPTAVKHAAGKKTVKTAVAPEKPTEKTPAGAAAPAEAQAGPPDAANPDDSTAPENKWAASGKRDPFVSPVVNHAGGSGCSTGKKCLEIGDINLRGIVHAEAGFIAVVTNNLNKAYFLHENDPVFNGFVTKITGDSVTFKETLQDRLGRTFTREVTKKIVAPAV